MQGKNDKSDDASDQHSDSTSDASGVNDKDDEDIIEK